MANTGFLQSSSVSLPNNSDTVTLTGSVDCSFVYSGTAVFIDGVLFEGISGSASDGGGTSTITLRDTYTGTAITAGVLVAFNTIEGLRDAIEDAKNLSSDVLDFQTNFGDILTSTDETISIDIAGVPTDITPYGYLAAEAAAISTTKVSIDGSTPMTGSLQMGTGAHRSEIDTSGNFRVISESLSGGWARGLNSYDNATRSGGIGFLGTASAMTSMHMGFGSSWWDINESFAVSETRISYKNDDIFHEGNIGVLASTAATRMTRVDLAKIGQTNLAEETTDVDTTTETGFRFAVDGANAPDTRFPYINLRGNASYQGQFGAGPDNKFFGRSLLGGIYQPWAEFWHSENFTPGDYVRLSGGVAETITGLKTFATDANFQNNINIETDGSYLRIGQDGNGRGAAIGTKMDSSTGTLDDYSMYIAYDCYWDENVNEWKSMRDDLTNKIVQKLEYHGGGGVAWYTFNGDTATQAAGWADDDMTEIMKLSLTGVLTLAGNTVWDAGNFNPANYLLDTTDTLTGTLTVGNQDTATPFIIDRNTSTSNVNMLFRHDSADRYLGIDAAGDLLFGNVANLQASGDLVYHAGNLGGVAVLTTGNETVAGDKTFSGETTFSNSVNFNTGDAIFFENKKHAITTNDGQGNFNIRVGHVATDVERCTEAGYAQHMEWEQSTGELQFNFSTASLAVDDAITWTKVLGLLPDGTATVSGQISASGGDSSEWNTAFSWGDWSTGVTKSFVDALNVDADTLDGLNSTSFLRSDADDTMSGSLTLTGIVVTDELRNRTGQQLVLNAGESHGQATGQTSEFVYMNAEGGVQINASPDDWGSLWAGRVTTTINSTGITWDGNTVYHAGNIPTWNQDTTGNAATATQLETARSIDLTGDVTATATNFDGTANIGIPTVMTSSRIPHRSTELPGSVDLNDYQTAGFYHQTANADATSGSNYPANIAGSLIVQNSAGVTQMYHGYGPQNRVYIRAFYNGTWEPWERLFADDYHPNADKLTTARSIDITGDVIGSAVLFDGTTDVAFNATVVQSADSQLLDGLDSTSFLRSNADDNLTSAIIVPNANRDEGMFGTYDPIKTQHIWSMGTAYRNHVDGTDFGNLYGAAYKHTSNATGGSMAQGHQLVWCQNGVGTSAIGTGVWTSGNMWEQGELLSTRYASATVSSSGNRWGVTAEINTSGVMETGRYIDFHGSDGSTDDYDWRMYLSSTAANPHMYFANDAGTVRFEFRDNGDLNADGDVTGGFSDIRLKDVIEPLSNCRDSVNSWELIKYTANDIAIQASPGTFDKTKVKVGMSAQSVQKNNPEVVEYAPFDRDGDGKSISGKNYLTLQYERTTPILAGAIQEQDVIIEDQSREIENLKARLLKMEKLVSKLTGE